MIFLELKVVMFMKTNNQKRKVGYIIMKKKIIAIVCAVLMLVGSVGVAKAAGTCPPHFTETERWAEEPGTDYSHQYVFEVRGSYGEVELITDWCLVCCEDVEYVYSCSKCDAITGGYTEHWECHCSCGQGDVIASVD